MEFFDLLNRRFSVRTYLDKPVDDAALNAILSAVNSAPSAFNAQAFEIVVVRDAAVKGHLAKMSWNQMFVAKAPVVLAFFANPERNREKLGDSAGTYSHEDAVIACDYAHLAAAALGLGSCWVAACGNTAVNEALGAPATWQSVALLAVGHPAEDQPPRQRRALETLAHRERVG